MRLKLTVTRLMHTFLSYALQCIREGQPAFQSVHTYLSSRLGAETDHVGMECSHELPGSPQAIAHVPDPHHREVPEGPLFCTHQGTD